jgi:hypothetical protein
MTNHDRVPLHELSVAILMEYVGLILWPLPHFNFVKVFAFVNLQVRCNSAVVSFVISCVLMLSLMVNTANEQLACTASFSIGFSFFV